MTDALPKIVNPTRTMMNQGILVYVETPDILLDDEGNAIAYERNNERPGIWLNNHFIRELREQQTSQNMNNMLGELTKIPGFSIDNMGNMGNALDRILLITSGKNEEAARGGGGGARGGGGGAGGGGGGGSHPSAVLLGLGKNRPVHGYMGPGLGRQAADALNTALRGVAGAGAAARDAFEGVTKRLKGKKKLSYREQVGEGIKHLKKSKEAMKLLNDYQKAIERGLADVEAGRNVDMKQLQKMLSDAEQLKQSMFGGEHVDLGGGHRKSRKRRRRKRRKTRRRKRRRHTRRRRKSKRRKSRKKR